MTLFFILFALGALSQILGHGIIMNPLGRGSVWRDPQFESLLPRPNWNDRELYCGGFYQQHWINGGQCGPCGDIWSQPGPREHENTGYYGKGIITGNYSAGQNIRVEIWVETAHLGHFEFRLCHLLNPSAPETNECFSDPLRILETGGTTYPIGDIDGMYVVTLQLPEGVRCNRCVLQWTYVTGNGYGECGDGTSALGCGPQETFRNCADISIN